MNELVSSNSRSLGMLEIRQQVDRHRQQGWQELDVRKVAFALTYVDCSYSRTETASRLGIGHAESVSLERDPLVQACVQDVQKQLMDIDILNQKWVDAKIMEIMPKLMGEEEVPMIDPRSGETYYGKKFHPEIIARLLDMKSPKKSQVEVKTTVDSGKRLENLADKLVGLLGKAREKVIEGQIVEKKDDNG